MMLFERAYKKSYKVLYNILHTPLLFISFYSGRGAIGHHDIDLLALLGDCRRRGRGHHPTGGRPVMGGGVGLYGVSEGGRGRHGVQRGPRFRRVDYDGVERLRNENIYLLIQE